jgi:hypothetical protein
MSTLCSNTVIACIVNLWLQEDHVNREDSRDGTTEYSEYYSSMNIMLFLSQVGSYATTCQVHVFGVRVCI